MCINNENLLNELAIDHDLNTHSKTKSPKLAKIKTKKGRCFTPMLTWCPVMRRMALTSLQEGKRIRLKLCGECVPVVGVAAT